MNLLDRMKLPFRKNKEFLSALYDILGFYPHDLEIYRVAFSHKSLNAQRPTAEGKSNNGKGGNAKANGKDRRGAASRRNDRRGRNNNDAPTRPLNNERLEYLGDAVLEAVVSDILFRHFSHKREGFLTSTRSKIVQREALNRLAEEMGLEKLILAAQGTRMSHTNIGGNAFEALMGAIYLDRGYKHCHWFITNRIVGHYVDLDNVAQKEVNFKSKLLEWSQKNRININFKDGSGEKGFHTVVTIEGIIISRGDGRSKKESQQEASKEALTRMRCEPKTYDNIFRAKEKRTAMEAEESFALPKIDEIEAGVGRNKKQAKSAPVLETKSQKSASDAAYDAAYDEKATFDVIDTLPEPEELTLAFCEEKGLPEPPQADELREADEKLRKKHQRNRGAKTMGDAVKGATKGITTAEEKAEKREAERLAEVERQRAKAERKRKEKEAQANAEKQSEKVEKRNDKSEDSAATTPKEPKAVVEEKKQKEKRIQPQSATPIEQPLSEEQKAACHETEQEHEVEQALMEADSQELTAEVAEQLATEIADSLVDNDVEESIEATNLPLLDQEEELLPETPLVAAPEEEDLIIAKDIAPLEEEAEPFSAEDAASETEVEEDSKEASETAVDSKETEVATEEEESDAVNVIEEEVSEAEEESEAEVLTDKEEGEEEEFASAEEADDEEPFDNADLDNANLGNEVQPQPNRKRSRRRGRRKKSSEGKPKTEGSQPQGKPTVEKQTKRPTQGEGEKPAKSKNTHRRNYNQRRRRGGDRNKPNE